MSSFVLHSSIISFFSFLLFSFFSIWLLLLVFLCVFFFFDHTFSLLLSSYLCPLPLSVKPIITFAVFFKITFFFFHYLFNVHPSSSALLLHITSIVLKHKVTSKDSTTDICNSRKQKKMKRIKQKQHSAMSGFLT